MEPGRLAAIMARPTLCDMRKEPVRLMSIRRRNMAGSYVSALMLESAMPAELTSTSGVPYRSTTCCTAALMALPSRTSTLKKDTSMPDFLWSSRRPRRRAPGWRRR